jgi:hypothetical protein
MPSTQHDPVAANGCRSRRLGVTSSTGARTIALMLADGSKAAVAEET